MLAVSCWLLVVRGCYFLIVASGVLLVVRCVVFAVCCLSSIGSSLFAVCCSFVFRCLLLVA